MPPPVLERYGKLIVLRDDLLPGGTKSIFMPKIKQKGIKEYVYPSPAYGYFQVALAKYFGDKATIFTAKRKRLTPPQEEVLQAGGRIIQIPYGYLKNVISKANEYVANVPTRKLVEWGGTTHQALITKRMKEVLRQTGRLDEIWMTIGSGTIIQGILDAVPPSTQVYGVQVGAEYKGDRPSNLHVIKYPRPFQYESKLEVPFPSNPNYDRKTLEIALRRARGKSLFWNVA